MLKIESSRVKSCIDWYVDYLTNMVTKRGIYINNYDLDYIIQNINTIVSKLKSLGLDINLNSSKQVLAWLKDYYKDIDGCDKVTDIIALKSSNSDDLVITLLARYFKLYGRFKILQGIYNYVDKDNYVYPQVELTTSNRAIFIEPNILTLPKDTLWEIIGLRNKEKALYTVDICTQEPKLMFNITNKDFLTKVGDSDVYNYIYSECAGKDCTAFERQDVKTLLNLLNYGGSKKCAYLSCNRLGNDLIDKIVKYYNSECKFNVFNKKCTMLAKHKVTTITNYFGTELSVSGDITTRKRTIQNLYIQSLGADIIALLVKHFDTQIKLLGLEGKISLYFTRVDEFIIEVDSSLLKTHNINSILVDIFEHQIDDWKPFNVKIDRVK